MSDFPDCLLLTRELGDIIAGWPRFPHRLALMPDGRRATSLGRETIATFLIEAECTAEVLNGLALPEYLNRRIPVLMHAVRARDLRPILKRSDRFRARGYTIEVLQ